jgi:outer membrane receptor protein involved in Fe transport
LLSASIFHKYIADPIEYVQRGGLFTFTTPLNYSSGKLTGLEFEARQEMGEVAETLDGLALGANATFIDSEVQVSDQEVADFQDLEVPMTSRDMTNAPEHLFNLYATYEVPRLGTQFGLFYTVTGDTLVAGAGVSDFNFVPSVYATQYDSLNFSLMQPLGDFFSLRFQAKNLTNPYIQEVYRSEYTGDDVLKSTYTRGIEYTLSIGAKFSF